MPQGREAGKHQVVAEMPGHFLVIQAQWTAPTLSVVPIKLVQSTVPALPRSAQAFPPPPGVCQLPCPAASEVKTFPAAWFPSTIFMVAPEVPTTSSLAPGLVVPIPTLPVLLITIAGLAAVPASPVPK